MLSIIVKVVSNSNLNNLIGIVVKDKVVEASKNLPLFIQVAKLTLWASLIDPWGESFPTFCCLPQPLFCHQVFHCFKAIAASCDTFFQIKVVSQ